MQNQKSSFGRYPKTFKALASFIRPFFPNLGRDLRQANVQKSSREHIAQNLVSTLYLFPILIILSYILLRAFVLTEYFVITLLVIFLISVLSFFRNMLAPKYLAQKRIRDIETNLIPALRSIHLQLDAGLPLFDVLVSVSKGDYGEVSNLFGKIVRKISSGKPQIEVLEEVSRNNPSLFFRRAIWQITNGLQSGGKISKVMEEVTDFLAQERFYEIQVYGSKLKALVMFYMLIVIIIPSLGIAFLVMLLSITGADPSFSKAIFIALEFLIILVQIAFFGVIKSSRPSLLRE